MAKKSNATRIKAELARALDAANSGDNVESTSPIMTEIATTAPEVSTAGSASLAAARIVNGSMLMAAGAGAIPLPLWDTAAVAAVQIKMLVDLSALYEVPFKQNLGQNALAALVGSLAPGMIARGTLGSYLKTIPGIGSVLGAVIQPAFSAAVTYAIGRVFIQHYESGGTLLSFRAAEFKGIFTEEVKAGMKKIRDIKI